MLNAILTNSTNLPIIVAHRGGSLENKLRGMQQTLLEVDYKPLMIEFDVRLSKDKQPVVFHDKTLYRIHNNKRALHKFTVNELEEYRIPSLEKTLNWFNTNALGKDICLAIELKDIGFFPNKTLVKRTLALIQQFEMQNRCMIISFNTRMLKKVKYYDPNILTGYITKHKLLNHSRFHLYKYIIDKARKNKADTLWLDHNIATHKLTYAAHMNKLPCFLWTANTSEHINQILSYGIGVSGIVTDYPELAMNILSNSSS